MSVDGIWTSELMGLFGWETTGILVLEHGRAIDGGNHHYSVGTYTVQDHQITIRLQVEYHGTPRTIFGASDKSLEVEVRCTVKDAQMEGYACRLDKPEQRVACRFTRRAPL